MLCIPTIQTIKMGMLALKTAAEFSLRQQFPKLLHLTQFS
jgi:hypothetical protein